MDLDMSSSLRLHPTAEAMYRFIIRFKRMNGGDSPSRREIAAGVGLPTVSIVQHHLAALETAGLIRRPRRGQARRIGIPGASWEFDEVGRQREGGGNGENKCAVPVVDEAAGSA